MHPSTVSTARPSRRTLLGAAACAVGAGMALAVGAPPAAAAATAAPPAVTRRLRRLEVRHGARLGVYGLDLATGRTVTHRAAERFPMCSVWKPLAAAAVLRDLDRHGEVLARRIRYTEDDLVTYSPITGTPQHLADGMTVEELCDAALRYSDNTAANLLLRQLGGPEAITRFCRSTGDTTTRLDRWETALNSAEPWRVTDTTSPRAIAGTFARVTVGHALTGRDRRRLTDWMLHNTTRTRSFGAGLPDDWAIADKTGSGAYGTNNDVGLAWPAGPHRGPLVLAVLTTKHTQDAQPDYPLVASAAEVLADALT
jgi:beta-lactamase class A